MNDKPLRAIIVDDEPLALEGLRLRLEKIPEVKIIAEASDGDQVEGVGGDPIFKHGLEPICERGLGGTDQDSAAFNSRVEHQGKDGKAEQGNDPPDQGFRHVPYCVVRFLGGQR